MFSYPTQQQIDAVKALTKDERDALTYQINNTPPEKLFNMAPDFRPICPVCGNGSGKNGTGASATETANGWLYGCRVPNGSGGQCLFNGLLTTVAAKELNINTAGNFNGWCTVLAAAANFVGISVDSVSLAQARYQRELKPKTAAMDVKEPKDYSKLYAFAAANLTAFVNKLGGKWRGLPLQFLKTTGAGYSPKNGDYEAGVILPYTVNHFFKRLVNDDGSCISDKAKSPKQHHGEMLTFYRAEDIRAGAVVFITEGEIDALSIKYISGGKITAIATGGADVWSKQITNLAQNYSTTAAKPKFAVLFDNDSAGDSGAVKLVDAITAAGFPAKSYHLRDTAQKFDANDWLLENPDALRERLNELYAIADAELSAIAAQLVHKSESQNLTDSDFRAGSVVEEKNTAHIAPALGYTSANVTTDVEEDFAAAFFAKRGILSDYRKLLSQPPSRVRDRAIQQLICGNLEWQVNPQTGTKVKPKASVRNYDAVFALDPALNKLFGKDEFSGSVVFLKQAPWRKYSCIGEQWTDADDAHLRLYLRRCYSEFGCDARTNDYFGATAEDCGFNVVRDWLENLPAWDGKPRAESVFVKFLHADDTAYTREVTLNWLTAAIARIYHPGCTYHYCLLLQGQQGCGKSYILEQLGGQWHVDLKDRLDSEKSIDALQLAWITELGELSATRKVDVNSLKVFLSESFDTHRFAYERRATRRPRHCVFAATCNDESPLNDTTGARRFNVIKCGNKRGQFVPGFTRDYVKQVWAEVLCKFKRKFTDGWDNSGNQLLLSPESQAIAARLAEGATMDDGVAGEIIAFLDKPIPPLPVWKLMTRAERREFFINGKFVIESCELAGRQAARRRPSETAVLEQILESAEVGNSVIQTERRGGFNGIPETVWYKFFGSVYREHVCAAEIYNECFSSNADKRKSMRRIAEVLSGLDGWQLGERIQGDSAYGDQRKIFVRLAPVQIDDTPADGIDINDTLQDDGVGNDTGGECIEAPAWDKPTGFIANSRQHKEIIQRERQRYDAEIERIKTTPAEELIPF